MSEETQFAYDRVLYPNYLHTQTHPDRLATMTKFFGIETAPVENCRVLELGCGTGSSLISFAYDLSGSEFVGIDLSAKQIELGNIAVRGIGLENLKLLQADIMKITRAEYGTFDYIIAHGIYSWVPEPVRDQIMVICRELLSEQGVAFINYNAYPGAHYRNMVRDMMNFHLRDTDLNPFDKVSEALGIMKFITDASTSKKPHHEVLEDEFEKLSKRNYQNIFHDELEEVNHPVYFYDFVRHAERYDLRFVTETEYFTSKKVSFPQEFLETLQQITDDPIAWEQYMDFISCRRFRQSLVCHRELKLSSEPDRRILRQLRIGSSLRPESKKIDLGSDKHEVFLGENDVRVEVDQPLVKAALLHLGNIWAQTVTFDELAEASRQMVAAESGAEFTVSENDLQILNEILFQLFCSGMLRLHVHQPRFTAEVSEKPLASPVARWQSRDNRSVATLLSTSVQLEDPLSRKLLSLLDGTRDHEQLLDEMIEFVDSPALDLPSEMKQNLLAALPAQMGKSLQVFADLALLVA